MLKNTVQLTAERLLQALTTFRQFMTKNHAPYVPDRSEELGCLVKQFEDKHGYGLLAQGNKLGEEAGEVNGAILVNEQRDLFKDDLDDPLEKEVGQLIFTAYTIAMLEGFDPMEAALDVGRENLDRE